MLHPQQRLDQSSPRHGRAGRRKSSSATPPPAPQRHREATLHGPQMVTDPRHDQCCRRRPTRHHRREQRDGSGAQRHQPRFLPAGRHPPSTARSTSCWIPPPTARPGRSSPATTRRARQAGRELLSRQRRSWRRITRRDQLHWRRQTPQPEQPLWHGDSGCPPSVTPATVASANGGRLAAIGRLPRRRPQTTTDEPARSPAAVWRYQRQKTDHDYQTPRACAGQCASCSSAVGRTLTATACVTPPSAWRLHLPTRCSPASGQGPAEHIRQVFDVGHREMVLVPTSHVLGVQTPTSCPSTGRRT